MLSDAQKQTVLQKCQIDPGTGNPDGFHGSRDRVISSDDWSTISDDVKDWVKNIFALVCRVYS